MKMTVLHSHANYLAQKSNQQVLAWTICYQEEKITASHQYSTIVNLIIAYPTIVQRNMKHKLIFSTEMIKMHSFYYTDEPSLWRGEDSWQAYWL